MRMCSPIVGLKRSISQETGLHVRSRPGCSGIFPALAAIFAELISCLIFLLTVLSILVILGLIRSVCCCRSDEECRHEERAQSTRFSVNNMPFIAGEPKWPLEEDSEFAPISVPCRDVAESTRPLTGHVAVVAGATRGAGRGIARALGEAGAIVYCTGRVFAAIPLRTGDPRRSTRPQRSSRRRAAQPSQSGSITPSNPRSSPFSADRSRAQSSGCPGQQHRRRGADDGTVELVLEDEPE